MALGITDVTDFVDNYLDNNPLAQLVVKTYTSGEARTAGLNRDAIIELDLEFLATHNQNPTASQTA